MHVLDRCRPVLEFAHHDVGVRGVRTAKAFPERSGRRCVIKGVVTIIVEQGVLPETAPMEASVASFPAALVAVVFRANISIALVKIAEGALLGHSRHRGGHHDEGVGGERSTTSNTKFVFMPASALFVVLPLYTLIVHATMHARNWNTVDTTLPLNMRAPPTAMFSTAVPGPKCVRLAFHHAARPKTGREPPPCRTLAHAHACTSPV
jgi:hypothetical protein